MQQSIRALWTVPTILGFSLLLSACMDDQAAQAPAAPPPPTVTIAKPVEQTVTHYESFAGTTEAFESVTIRARVSGMLQKVHFEEGRIVRKGDLLFTIEPDVYQARVDEAKAMLGQRQAELQLAKATKTKTENAYKGNATTEIAVLEAKAGLAGARSAVNAAKAALKNAQLDLSYTQIHAPIDGRVGRRLVDEGNLVGVGELTQLTTIVNTSPIYAYFQVNERDLMNYQLQSDDPQALGTRALPVEMRLAGHDELVFNGTIDFVDNRVDVSVGTIQARAIFDNPNHVLMPGLFARLRVPVGEPKAQLLVPETAVGQDQQGNFLLLAGEDNKVVYRPVTKGDLVGKQRAITTGLTKQDNVIVRGLQKARPGTMVNPVFADAAVAAANGSGQQ